MCMYIDTCLSFVFWYKELGKYKYKFKSIASAQRSASFRYHNRDDVTQYNTKMNINILCNFSGNMTFFFGVKHIYGAQPLYIYMCMYVCTPLIGIMIPDSLTHSHTHSSYLPTYLPTLQTQ